MPIGYCATAERLKRPEELKMGVTAEVPNENMLRLLDLTLKPSEVMYVVRTSPGSMLYCYNIVTEEKGDW